MASQLESLPSDVDTPLSSDPGMVDITYIMVMITLCVIARYVVKYGMVVVKYDGMIWWSIVDYNMMVW